MPRRIGILGGTFDPPHAAHLGIARAVIAADLVDELLVIPAGDPWQKADVTPIADRLAMTRIAFAGEPLCHVSDLEAQRDGATYAIDTVNALTAPDVQLRFIVGSDTFAKLDTWHRIADVVRLCDFLVVERPGVPLAQPSVSGVSFERVPMPPVDVASTDIREALVSGAPRPRQVPMGVWDYIVANRLYGVQHSTLRRPLIRTTLALLAAVAVLLSGFTLAAQGVFVTRTPASSDLSSGWVAIGVRAPESQGGVVTVLPVGGPELTAQALQLPAAERALRRNAPEELRDAVGSALQRPMAGAVVLDRLAFAGLVDAVDGIETDLGRLNGVAAAAAVLADPTGARLHAAVVSLLRELPANEQQLTGLVRSLGSALKATDGATTVVRWLEFWQSRL